MMMPALDNIRHVILQNGLDYSHFAMARFIGRKLQNVTETCLWLLILVNEEVRRGNVCLRLTDIPARFDELGLAGLLADPPLPQLIQNSPLTGAESDNRPLVLYADSLYLNRYYFSEKTIADCLLALSRISEQFTPENVVVIDCLFPHGDEPDYQKLAAIVSCRHRLCIISGGPGTGKTWTVARILELLHDRYATRQIKLAAPTGKAAARLSQSIRLQLDNNSMPGSVFEAQTLHRLLGVHRYTHRPRYNRHNPLPCDLLIVDEASMIDQQMMSLLCASLTADCRLILLGDKDQLSSVEAGSVFADICGGLPHTQFSAQQVAWLRDYWPVTVPSQQTRHALADNVVVLEKSHRFDDASGIGRLARSINRGHVDECLTILQASTQGGNVEWRQPRQEELARLLALQAAEYYSPLIAATGIQQAFACLHGFRILSPLWDGPAGVDGINKIIEQTMLHQCGLPDATEFYPGKPLIMTANLHQYELYNGDIGIVWPDDDGCLGAWFETPQGGFRQLSLSQLPQYKSAYAMTVHKSQGSEFERVLVVLPQTDTPVLTRELLYTAITRATTALEIWGTEAIMSQTIARKTQRVSGLLQRFEQP